MRTLLLVSACRVEPETRTVFRTQTVTQTETLTTTITHTIYEDFEPGHFLPPLQKLARSEGDRMHLEEVRYRDSDGLLFYCSLTFGVLDASDPTRPEPVTQDHKWDTGSRRKSGCLHLDWDDTDPDIVYVSHPGNVDFLPHLSAVDLGEKPLLQGPSLQEEGVSYEGLDAEGGLLYVALHEGGLGVFQRDPLTHALSRVGGDDTWVSNAYDVDVVGTTAYVIDEQTGLVVLDVTDPQNITRISSLYVWGVHRDLCVDGDFAYLASGPAGLAIVDISDPAAPVLVSVTDMPGTATSLGVSGERVAVAAWNDVRVFDASEPVAPAFIGAVRLEQDQRYADDELGRPDTTARSFGADLSGDVLFVGNWNAPYLYRIHEENLAPYAVFPEDIYYMDFGTVPPGQDHERIVGIHNDGTAPLTIYDVWTTSPSFTVSPPGAVLAPGARAEFTLTYTASTSEREVALVSFQMDDPSWPVRKGYLVGNAPETGVGDPFPYTVATNVFTESRWTSEELLGKVTLLAYFATF
jgi:hypothetical protein